MQSTNTPDMFATADQKLAPLLKIVDTLGTVGASMQTAASLFDSLMEKFGDGISKSDEQVAQLSASLGDLVKSIVPVGEQLRTFGDASKSFVEIAFVAETHTKELETNLSRSGKVVAILHDELLAATKSVADKLRSEP